MHDVARGVNLKMSHRGAAVADLCAAAAGVEAAIADLYRVLSGAPDTAGQAARTFRRLSDLHRSRIAVLQLPIRSLEAGPMTVSTPETGAPHQGLTGLEQLRSEVLFVSSVARRCPFTVAWALDAATAVEASGLDSRWVYDADVLAHAGLPQRAREAAAARERRIVRLSRLLRHLKRDAARGLSQRVSE